MPRDVRVQLDDILEACKRVSTYTAGLSLEKFRSDQKTIDAVVRNLEVILIHEYFGIDVDIIWDIVQNKVPDLSAQSVTSGEPAGFARS